MRDVTDSEQANLWHASALTLEEFIRLAEFNNDPSIKDHLYELICMRQAKGDIKVAYDLIDIRDCL